MSLAITQLYRITRNPTFADTFPVDTWTFGPEDRPLKNVFLEVYRKVRSRSYVFVPFRIVNLQYGIEQILNSAAIAIAAGSRKSILYMEKVRRIPYHKKGGDVIQAS